MATRAQKVRLAMFFVVVNGLLAAFLLFVVGGHLLTERHPYRVEFVGVSVGGLSNGAPVKYQGLTVGRVEDTYISPSDIGTVVVEVSLEPGSVSGAIRTDTRAVIHNLGITGLKYIDLVPGSNDAAPLPPGSLIQAGETFLSDIDRQAEILTNKVELLLDRVNLLLSEQNRDEFTRTLAATGSLTRNASDLVQDNRQHIDATLANVALASEALVAATGTLRASVDSLHAMVSSPRTHAVLEDVETSARRMRETLEGPLPELLGSMTQMTQNADRTFIHVDQTVLQSRNSLINAMRDMEEALQNIRELSELIRDNPSILIRGGSRSDGQN